MFHDRFIIHEEKTPYHIGASINELEKELWCFVTEKLRNSNRDIKSADDYILLIRKIGLYRL